MFKQTMLFLSAIFLVFSVQSLYAADMQGMDEMKMQKDTGGTAMQIHKGHGMVNKVNARSGKINITHDPIESMDWPKMTMDFSVQDKAELDNIKPGMKVEFDLTVKGKGYRITKIAPAK